MKTLLKRSLYDPRTQSIIIDDFDDSDSLPVANILYLSADVISDEVVDGFFWVEEQHTTWMPRILVMLFFWAVKPKVEHRAYICLLKNNMRLTYNFVYDKSKSVVDNIESNKAAFNIREIWYRSPLTT